MSHNINAIKVDNNNTVSVGSFSGGILRGQCIQLDQFRNGKLNVLELTREQASILQADLDYWLGTK